MGNPRRAYTPGIQGTSRVGTCRWQEKLEPDRREYTIKESLIPRWQQEFLERPPQFRQVRLAAGREQTDAVA